MLLFKQDESIYRVLLRLLKAQCAGADAASKPQRGGSRKGNVSLSGSTRVPAKRGQNATRQKAAKFTESSSTVNFTTEMTSCGSNPRAPQSFWLQTCWPRRLRAFPGRAVARRLFAACFLPRQMVFLPVPAAAFKLALRWLFAFLSEISGWCSAFPSAFSSLFRLLLGVIFLSFSALPFWVGFQFSFRLLQLIRLSPGRGRLKFHFPDCSSPVPSLHLVVKLVCPSRLLSAPSVNLLCHTTTSSNLPAIPLAASDSSEAQALAAAALSYVFAWRFCQGFHS